MDIPPETEDYIRESIEGSLGLAVPSRTLRLKLLASEDERRRLQDEIYVLHDRLKDADKRLEKCRAEASMNALGLRKCIEEKEVLSSEYANLVEHCSKLEKECSLYERDLEKFMETCDELGKENEELRARLQDNSSITKLVAVIEALKDDQKNLRVNLCRAEEEVNVLFEENKILDEENKRLVGQLKRERHHQGSEHTASNSTKGKRKSRLKESSPEQALDIRGGSPRQPLSPLQHNSPSPRIHKKQNGAT